MEIEQIHNYLALIEIPEKLSVATLKKEVPTYNLPCLFAIARNGPQNWATTFLYFHLPIEHYLYGYNFKKTISLTSNSSQCRWLLASIFIFWQACNKCILRSSSTTVWSLSNCSTKETMEMPRMNLKEQEDLYRTRPKKGCIKSRNERTCCTNIQPTPPNEPKIEAFPLKNNVSTSRGTC